jgi:hypothetical protein
VTATARTATGAFPLRTPVARERIALPTATARSAAALARDAHERLDRRALLDGLVAWLAGLAGLGLAVAAGLGWAARRGTATRRADGVGVGETLVHS